MPHVSDRYRFTRLNSFRDRGPVVGATMWICSYRCARAGADGGRAELPAASAWDTEAALIEVLAETGLTLTALSLRLKGRTSPMARSRAASNAGAAIRLAQDAVELAARLAFPTSTSGSRTTGSTTVPGRLRPALGRRGRRLPERGRARPGDPH